MPARQWQTAFLVLHKTLHAEVNLVWGPGACGQMRWWRYRVVSHRTRLARCCFVIPVEGLRMHWQQIAGSNSVATGRKAAARMAECCDRSNAIQLHLGSVIIVIPSEAS